jgi:prepilin-type N-terminal cleavage/methylation domain-containing protein
MKMHHSSIIQDQIDGEKDDKGFTLIEILIAIVLVGILSAVAVVGISSLVSKGGKSACQASVDSAKAGSAVYFAENSTYPATLSAVANGVFMTLPSGVTVNPAAFAGPAVAGRPIAAANMQTLGGSWYMTMTSAGTATTAPVFDVCV